MQPPDIVLLELNLTKYATMRYCFFLVKYLINSASVRYRGSGVVSYEQWDILNFSRHNLEKRVPFEHQGILLQNFRFDDFEPLPHLGVLPVRVFGHQQSARCLAIMDDDDPCLHLFDHDGLNHLACLAIGQIFEGHHDICYYGDNKLQEANVTDFYCNILQILDLVDISKSDRQRDL